MTDQSQRIPWGRLSIELFVIISGILLALAIESWWGDRADERKVQTYLVALEEDLLADSLFYADVIFPRLTRKRQILDSIAPVVRGRAPVPTDTLAFLDQVAFGGLFGIPGGFVLGERTTMDELIATGALGLFESAKLRAELTAYYTESEAAGVRASALMPNYPRFVHGVYPAELRDARTDEDTRRWGTERAVATFLSPEFETVMNQEYNYMLHLERLMNDLEARVQALLLRVRCAQGERQECAILARRDAPQ